MAFIRRLLDCVFETNNGANEIMAVEGMAAMGLAKTTEDGLKGLTVAEAEACLRGLVDEGWMIRAGGWYSLAPRALLELRDWLRETYNDDEVTRVKQCFACKEIITVVCITSLSSQG